MFHSKFIQILVILFLSTSASHAHHGWEQSADEVTALAQALFWESAMENEPPEGVRAIAHVILNRVKSRNFPDTIRGVVTQGVKKGKRGGCQFSFACDGAPDDFATMCKLHPKDTKARGGMEFCKLRWMKYMYIAHYLYLHPGKDPTCGAVLYYTGKKPYWTVDFVTGSVRKFGSHTFGRSKKVGTDISGCTTTESDLQMVRRDL